MLSRTPRPSGFVTSRGLASLIVLALLVAACTGTSDAPGGDGPASNGSGVQPAPVTGSASASIRLVPELATTQAVVANVGPDGATLTAEDGAGTTYVLEIPPNALAASVEVSLTPVTAVSGLPDGVDWHFGVEFSPSGLQLALPGLLTIQRADVADVEFVGYRGPDRDVYLTEGFLQQGQALIQIGGFSGRGGVGCAGSCSSAGLAPLPPVDPTNAYEARRVTRRAVLGSTARPANCRAKPSATRCGTR